MKKFLRSLSLKASTYVAKGAGIGAGIGTAATAALAVAAPAVSVEGFLLVDLIIGGTLSAIGACIGGVADLDKQNSYSLDKNSIVINNLKIVGKKSDLKKILRVQRYIDGATKKYEVHPVLPCAVQDKIMDHVRDVQLVFENCKVYNDSYIGRSDVLQEEFPFIREFYNSRGNKEKQTLVSIQLLTQEAAETAFQHTVLPALKIQKMQAEFEKAAKLAQDNAQKPSGPKLEL